MGYQSRARNFSFMGVDSTRRTVEVVPPKEEFPAMIEPPTGEERVIGSTVTLRTPAFVMALLSGRVRLRH
jgi:hypothetical protein